MSEDKQEPAPEQKPAEEGIPRFRFPEKKVDSSWKDEVKKQRETGDVAPAASAGAPASAAPAQAGPGKAPASAGGAAKVTGPQPSKMFLSLVASLVHQTLMQLGQVENPFSGQREVDLEGARGTIDLLAGLEQKTRGNLHEQEAKALHDALRELQLYYVELSREVGRQMQEQLKKGGPAGPGGPAGRKR